MSRHTTHLVDTPMGTGETTTTTDTQQTKHTHKLKTNKSDQPECAHATLLDFVSCKANDRTPLVNLVFLRAFALFFHTYDGNPPLFFSKHLLVIDMQHSLASERSTVIRTDACTS